MTETLKPFVITRSTWDRGNQIGSLLRADGKQCCLGQFCSRVLGLPDSKLRGRRQLDDIADSLPPAIQNWGVVRRPSGLCIATDAAAALMAVNDSQRLQEPEREVEVAAAFAGLGYDVHFED